MPVAYSHVVFTLPETLGPSALQTPTMDYDVLFQAVSETLLEVAANPTRRGTDRLFGRAAHLGPEPVATPASRLRGAGRRTFTDGAGLGSRPGRLFPPVRVLSRVFRGRAIRLIDGSLIAIIDGLGMAS